jgi:flagellar transcriptional activator FlhD
MRPPPLRHSSYQTRMKLTHDHTDSLARIRELNLAYLLLAQRLLDEDRIAAMYRLDLSETTADIIASLTPSQARRIAMSTELIWQLRLDNPVTLSALIKGETKSALPHLHASIVLGETSCKPAP